MFSHYVKTGGLKQRELIYLPGSDRVVGPDLIQVQLTTVDHGPLKQPITAGFIETANHNRFYRNSQSQQVLWNSQSQHVLYGTYLN